MDCCAFCNISGAADGIRQTIEQNWDVLNEGWDGKVPDFLTLDFFEKVYPLCKSETPQDEARPYVQEVVRLAQENEYIAQLAYILHRSSYEMTPAMHLNGFPASLPVLGEKYTGMFALMLQLSSYPNIRKAYASRGIPERYADAAMKSIGGTMRRYAYAHNGIPGTGGLTGGWTRGYIDNRLYRIGRLEYLIEAWQPGLMPNIYRDGKGGLVVFAPKNWYFDENGVRSGSTETRPVQFYTTPEKITGNRILPDGTVELDHLTSIDAKEWHPVVSPWDMAVTMHIPTGGRMPVEELRASMMEAHDFFQKYFKQYLPLFFCCSWILNPAWEDYMPNSNMTAFRKNSWCVQALPWGPLSGAVFIFGTDTPDLEHLQPQNTIERVFQQAWRDNRLNVGSLFVLAEDIEKFGTEYYRSNFSC